MSKSDHADFEVCVLFINRTSVEVIEVIFYFILHGHGIWNNKRPTVFISSGKCVLSRILNCIFINISIHPIIFTPRHFVSNWQNVWQSLIFCITGLKMYDLISVLQCFKSNILKCKKVDCLKKFNFGNGIWRIVHLILLDFFVFDF